MGEGVKLRAVPQLRMQLALLMLIALAHGLIYAFAIPLWQAPDEPMLFEYAALTAELGRIPAGDDRSPALEARLLASLSANAFWSYRRVTLPEPPPADFVELRRMINMPRQVGGDPPLYFALAAIPLRLSAGWSVEAQAYLLRSLNALLLPLAVACVYSAARYLVSDPVGSLAQVAPLAAASLVALHPMFTHIGATVSNDGLANLLAALLCLLSVRALARGLPGRDLLVIAAVALAAAQTKRTAAPYALLAALLCCVWLVRLAMRPGPGAHRRRGLAVALALGVPVATAALLASQLAWGAAARWYDASSLLPAPRASAGGGYALAIEQGHEVIQVLPDVATAHLRNGAVVVGARVWGDGPATGRLVLYTGELRQEFAFAVERMSVAELRAAVPTTAHDVRLGVVADSGRLYAADLWARGVGLPGGLLANGDLSRPALQPDSALVPAMRYLRLAELIWIVEGGRLQWSLALDSWASWLFVSFWGHFGWMDVAFVRGSLWEPFVAAMAAVGLVGAALALARGREVRRPAVATLFALIVLAIGPLFAYALLEPQLVQQGRYLFPILPALAALIALGQATLLPPRARDLWALAWLACWLCFAGAALATLARHYAG